MISQSTIPLFPLALVLFPAERRPLHVFERRYREMAGVCLRDGSPFGILRLHDDQLAEIGCTARITQVVQRYRDGRLDIIVGGERRFRVLRTHDSRAYPTAEVEYLRESASAASQDKVERVITQHMRLLELAGRTVRPGIYQTDNPVSYVIAHNAGLSLDQQQAVLQISTEEERVEYLIAHIRRLLVRLARTDALRRQIRSNGHFRDSSPEKK